MATATDTESSSRRRVGYSLGGHVLVLEAMLARMTAERDALPAYAIAARVRMDVRIRNVERDLRLVRARWLGQDHPR